MELDSFLSEIKSSPKEENEELIATLERLSCLCQTLSRLGPMYDWENVPHNGYRSMVKLCDLFTVKVLRPDWKSGKINLESVTGTLELFISMAEKAIHHQEQGEKQFTPGDDNDPIVVAFTESRSHFIQLEPYLKQYWGYYGLFWMTDDSRWAPYIFSFLYTLVHRLPKSLLASISKDEYGTIMTTSTWKATPFFPINLANYVNNFISRTYSGIKFRVSGVDYQELFVPRQTKWIVNENGSRFTSSEPPSDSHFTNGDPILCHLMKYKPCEPSGDIILHAQGGGLVIDVRQFHEEYLRDWIPKLKGAMIINVAYSRFVRYPYALQELLDVYLWLIKGDQNEVYKFLGFKPKRIICLGDSAGCYLLFSMCLALRDIQLIEPSAIPIYPKALVALSPILSSAAPRLFSSYVLSYVDVFLCPALLIHCFSLYGSGIIFDSDCNDLDSNDGRPTSPQSTAPWIKDNYTVPSSSFKNFYNTWIKSGKSWTDCDEDLYMSRLRQMAPRIEIPYISPLLGYDFNEVHDLELFLISSEFDPLLDNNIEIAKNWKGKVTLDVVDRMAHGFSAYYSLSNTCYKASQVGLQRLLEAIS